MIHLIDAGVAEFVLDAKAKAADGLTWGEFGELLTSLLRLTVSILDRVSSMTGAEKKAAAIEAAGMLFDAVADYAVPTLLLPVWFLIRPAVRSLVLALAGGAIETLLPMIRGQA